MSQKVSFGMMTVCVWSKWCFRAIRCTHQNGSNRESLAALSPHIWVRVSFHTHTQSKVILKSEHHWRLRQINWDQFPFKFKQIHWRLALTEQKYAKISLWIDKTFADFRHSFFFCKTQKTIQCKQRYYSTLKTCPRVRERERMIFALKYETFGT